MFVIESDEDTAEIWFIYKIKFNYELGKRFDEFCDKEKRGHSAQMAMIVKEFLNHRIGK